MGEGFCRVPCPVLLGVWAPSWEELSLNLASYAPCCRSQKMGGLTWLSQEPVSKADNRCRCSPGTCSVPGAVWQALDRHCLVEFLEQLFGVGASQIPVGRKRMSLTPLSFARVGSVSEVPPPTAHGVLSSVWGE